MTKYGAAHYKILKIAAVFESGEVFDQNLRLLIPVRLKFYRIPDFNFPRELSFSQFATLNSSDF